MDATVRKVIDFFSLIIADIIFFGASFYLALVLRFEGEIPKSIISNINNNMIIVIGTFLLLSLTLNCYNGVWKFTGLYELFRQFAAVVLSCSLLLVFKFSNNFDMPGSVIVITGVLAFIFTSAVRILPRFMRRVKNILGTNQKDASRALIIGAGTSGAVLIKRLKDYSNEVIQPVACVDDDLKKKNMRVCGVRVLGTTDDINKIVQKNKINLIIIALPGVDTPTIRNIYKKCSETGVPVKLFQKVIDIEEFLNGKQSALKPVSIEDLLFRDSINVNTNEAEEYLRGKTVLVTGGAGSIGSELSRQALKNNCKKLIIFDISENSLFELNEELKSSYSRTQYELVLGSVRDISYLENIFSKYKPQVVFHAAAHKHVPMIEINPFEAVKNNIIGTKNVIDVCKKYKTSKFILISTDKAVRPTSVMGASKRIAELIVKAENCQQTEMAAVRFGNVLGSNGSVVPLFKNQIAAGGPVTITDPEITRYFMTIPEAVSLVQCAAALAKGGEIFVLDMGVPVKIYDLACDLIRLSGLEPYKDIDIKFTGLRPGEKLYEELSLESESVDATSHSKIFVMRSSNVVNQFSLYRDIADIVSCAREGKDEDRLHSLIFNAIDEEKMEQNHIIDLGKKTALYR